MRELNDDYMAERAEWIPWNPPQYQARWWFLAGVIFGLSAAVVEFFWGRA